MAKIHRQTLVVEMSKLLKDSNESGPFLTDEVVEAMESIIEELVADPSVVVEVVKSDE